MLVTLLWSLAAPLVWAAADVVQAARASGGVGIARVAIVTLLLYALLGLFLFPFASLLRRRSGHAPALALAFTAAGLLFSIGYVNVSWLPSIANPLSIGANLAMAALAAAVFLLLSRSRAVAALQRSASAAVLVTIAAASLALYVAQPSGARRGELGLHATAAATAPSVFVIVIDSVRADRTSLGGRSDGPMPAFEKLAAGGWSFSRAWAQSSWTKPSVGSIFTSLYPTSHGATLRTGRLAAGPATLPEQFARAGYATAVFSSNPWVAPAFGFDRGVGSFVETERESFLRLSILRRVLRLADGLLPGAPVASVLGRLERALGASEPHRSNCERDVVLAEDFERWLGAAGAGPVFAYVHLMSPHLPYDPPGLAHEDFSDAEQVELQRKSDALEPARLARLVSLYDASVAHGDSMLARMVAAIDASPLGQGAIVVATADHGEEFHEHGSWGHGNNLFEETIHVPLAIRAPGLAPRRIDTPVMLVDLLPTLAALAGAGAATGAQHGGDLRTTPADRAAYSELDREGGYEADALVRGSTKYLESKAGLGASQEKQLFDLHDDPKEAVNRAASTPASVLGEWATALAAERDKGEKDRFSSTTATIDEDSAKRLRGLGYVQ